MTRDYVVFHPTFGQIRKAADSIAEARAWARTALGPDARVSLPYRFCGDCQSAPCACPRRTLLVAADAQGRPKRILRDVMAALALVAILPASGARAQAHRGRPDQAALVTYAAAAALDLHSTFLTLHRGGVEENPVLASLDRQPAAFVAYSAALDMTSVTLLRRWLAPAHPRLTRVVLYTIAAVRLRFALRNYAEAGYQRQLNDQAFRLALAVEGR